MASNDIMLDIDEQVNILLEERGIRKEEIIQIIQKAESTGDKLYQTGPERYLAKLRISNATFYTEYSVDGDTCKIHTAYSHMAEIKE